MSITTSYDVPSGELGLKRAVTRPAPGTLPLRGDLAHIALADRYLAAHYVVPIAATVGAQSTAFRLQPREDAELGAPLDAGQPIELLDLLGDWCWAAIGPEGPSGYLERKMIEIENSDGPL